MAKPQAPSPEPQVGHIKDLKTARNARKHNPRNIGMIADSMQANGAGRSILLDENDVILAGNGTIEAAAQAGITKVIIVESDGDAIIAHRRTGLTQQQKDDLALSDNRAAELAEWDPDVLREMQAEGVDLGPHFTPDELAAIIDDGETSPVEKITVERPQDVAWLLLAIPVAEWPLHQEAIEQLQVAAKFSTMVLRPADGSRGVVADPKAAL